MWVAPHAGHLGLARRFLRELETRALAHGRDVLRPDTDRALDAASGLYHSAGFRRYPPSTTSRTPVTGSRSGSAEGRRPLNRKPSAP